MNTLKKDFYSANEELKQIYENSLTQRNKNQIKSNLVDAINKVIKEITLNVMALENSIEKGFSDDHIYLFKGNNEKITEVLSQTLLLNYHDKKKNEIY